MLAKANAFHSLPLRNITDDVEIELSITCPDAKCLNFQPRVKVIISKDFHVSKYLLSHDLLLNEVTR